MVLGLWRLQSTLVWVLTLYVQASGKRQHKNRLKNAVQRELPRPKKTRRPVARSESHDPRRLPVLSPHYQDDLGDAHLSKLMYSLYFSRTSLCRCLFWTFLAMCYIFLAILFACISWYPACTY